MNNYVAIIDDGVNSRELGDALIGSYCVDNGQVKQVADNNDVETHGTICAKIIKKYARDVNFISLKILSSSGLGSIGDLTSALRWCLNSRIGIINLSIGIELASSEIELYDICRRLAERGVFIVAAQSNKPVETIPAVFPFVLSVEQIQGIRNINELRKSNIYASGRHSIRMVTTNKKHVTRASNSFACAFACAHIVASMNEPHYLEPKALLLAGHPLIISSRIGTYELRFLREYADGTAAFHHDIDNEQFKPQIPGLGRTAICETQGEAVKLLNYCENKTPEFESIICLDMSATTMRIRRLAKRQKVRLWLAPRDKTLSLCKYKSPTSFIIQVISSGDSDSICRFVSDLNNCFKEDGYTTLCLTDIREGCLYGFALAKPHSIWKKACRYSEVIKPDIIIVGSSFQLPNSDCRLFLSGERVVDMQQQEFEANDLCSLRDSIIDCYARN